MTDRKQELAQLIEPYYDPHGPEYKASDGEMYRLHIEGLPGSQYVCVLDNEGKAYDVMDVKDDKIHFIRYLCTRPGVSDKWFGPICGNPWWYIDMGEDK